MRLILQGRKPDVATIPDVWLAFGQSGTFLTSPYLAKGYNRVDSYVVGGGGGGGNGGKSYYGGPGVYTPGGGGGGGGAGRLLMRLAVDLFSLPISIPYTVGVGGKGSVSVTNPPEERAGYDGEFSNFGDNNLALGGLGGGGGTNGASTLSGGGYGGGGGAGGLSAVTYNTYPNTVGNPAKGSTGNQGAGNGGNGGTNTINATPGTPGYDGTLEAVPIFGEAYEDAIFFGGGGGGGGGPGIFRNNGLEYRDSAGASGGLGWHSILGSVSPQNEGLQFSASGIYKAGGGGGGGFGPNLASVYRMSNLRGQPLIDTNGSGLPGAGGAGGAGGISQTDARLGNVGRTGASGCILLRLYSANQ